MNGAPGGRQRSPRLVCLAAAAAVCNTYLFTGATEALWEISSLFSLALSVALLTKPLTSLTFPSELPSPSRLTDAATSPVKILAGTFSLSPGGNSGNPLPLKKPSGSVRKPIRSHRGHASTPRQAANHGAGSRGEGGVARRGLS